MLLKAKLNFMSGIAIGAAAVMVMKQVFNVNGARNIRKPLHPLLRLANTLKFAGKVAAEE